MKSINVAESEGIFHVKLSRPEKANAFDFEMADGLSREIFAASRRKSVRAVFLEGEGRHFCAGADLDWMLGAAKLSKSANIKDAMVLARLYDALEKCPLPIVARVHGRVYGGGFGLTAISDIVAASIDTTFALPEARLGLIPGVLTPIVQRKIGFSLFSELALSGREMGATEAQAAGLIHFHGSSGEIEQYLKKTLHSITESDASSLTWIKRHRGEKITTAQLEKIARDIANARVKPEAQARLAKLRGSRQ
jgi:methylglutaconyl-CoA hydratase